MPFLRPISDRYFEDYVEGDVHHFGTIAVEADEIVAFANQFDPQTLHTDPEAAKSGPFGGLIASGWHTAGLMTRLFMDHYLTKVASLGSPGGDELRWFKPVRPGDTLSVRVTVLKAVPAVSHCGPLQKGWRIEAFRRRMAATGLLCRLLACLIGLG